MLKTTNEIDIVRVKNSKINEVDFENLAFGNTFTDHMLVCDFKDGKWQKPIIKPYEPFLIDPSAKVFHYGQAIFEGMKANRSSEGDVLIFRPEMNARRFQESCIRMGMPIVPEALFVECVRKLVDLDREWIPNKPGYSFIRD
jgi:branched-chain amino acid aminotransferase